MVVLMEYIVMVKQKVVKDYINKIMKKLTVKEILN